MRMTKEWFPGRAEVKQENTEYLKARRPFSERTVFKMEGTS